MVGFQTYIYTTIWCSFKHVQIDFTSKQCLVYITIHIYYVWYHTCILFDQTRVIRISKYREQIEIYSIVIYNVQFFNIPKFLQISSKYTCNYIISQTRFTVNIFIILACVNNNRELIKKNHSKDFNWFEITTLLVWCWMSAAISS